MLLGAEWGPRPRAQRDAWLQMSKGAGQLETDWQGQTPPDSWLCLGHLTSFVLILLSHTGHSNSSYVEAS